MDMAKITASKTPFIVLFTLVIIVASLFVTFLAQQTIAGRTTETRSYASEPLRRGSSDVLLHSGESMGVNCGDGVAHVEWTSPDTEMMVYCDAQ